MILRPNAPVVVISAETARFLEAAAGLAGLRLRVNGVNPRIFKDLEDIRDLARTWTPELVPVLPERTEVSPEAPPESDVWLTSVQVADRLRITDRAVRLACSQGRLDGELVGDRWQISPDALKNYSPRNR